MSAALLSHIADGGTGASLETEPRTIYLHPGQIVVVSQPAMITTVLGSCVSVCLWDPVARVAGINHFLLPLLPMRGESEERYGNTAMQRLIDDVLALGGVMHRLTAKVFGGANVLMPNNARKSIGIQNVEVARDILHLHEIEIAADETGGRHGRKLHFDTATGGVWVKELV